MIVLMKVLIYNIFAFPINSENYIDLFIFRAYNRK